MSIRINLYDLFTYVIPGFLFIIESIYFIEFVIGKNLNSIQLLQNINIAHFFIVLIFSYIIGHLISYISYLLIHFPYNIKKMFKRTKEKEIEGNNALDKQRKFEYDLTFHKLIYDDKKYLPAFCSIIQEENPEQMLFCQKFHANSFMARNIGMLLFLFAIIELYYTIFRSLEALHIFLMILSNIIGLIFIVRSKTFMSLHIKFVLDSIVGRAIKLKPLVEEKNYRNQH